MYFICEYFMYTIHITFLYRLMTGVTLIKQRVELNSGESQQRGFIIVERCRKLLYLKYGFSVNCISLKFQLSKRFMHSICNNFF